MTTERLNESYAVRSGRASVEVKADPLAVETDAGVLAAPIAAAIATAISTGIRAVGEAASAATVRARKGHGSASTRALNDTGRLAAGITVQRTGDSFAIVPPADRLNPADFRSPQAYQHVVDQLHALVPATADPFGDPAVEAAIGDALDEMLK